MYRLFLAFLLAGVLIGVTGCGAPTGANSGSARICGESHARDCPPTARRFPAGDRGR